MRRIDTHWRDSKLILKHAAHGFVLPVHGMQLPMIEYDRGDPLALISYQPRGFQDRQPKDPRILGAYRAFGKLHRETGEQIPFFTAEYDARNWAYRLYPHNGSAQAFLDVERIDWVRMTERHFSNNLYRLRGRVAPDLAPYGVEFADGPWNGQGAADDPLKGELWPGQTVSQRRRNFEPVSQVRMSLRNPCVDVDFAVIDSMNRVALLVDYKTNGARIGLGSTNLKALSSLHTTWSRYQTEIPAMVVRYEPGPKDWTFHVNCLNKSARNALAYGLGASPDSVTALADTIAGVEWTRLSETEWFEVLNVSARL